jgi:hypothetical protein
MRKIKTNKARCRLCGDRRCRCGEIAVDGGRSYLRRLAGNFANLEELSEYHESADKPLSELPS